MSEIVIYPNNSGRINENYVSKGAIRCLLAYLKIRMFRVSNHPDSSDRIQIADDIIIVFSNGYGNDLNKRKHYATYTGS